MYKFMTVTMRSTRRTYYGKGDCSLEGQGQEASNHGVKGQVFLEALERPGSG